MPADKRPVAIVGAGLAGVTAAAALRQQGVPVRLFEAGKQIAGLAASYQDSEGFSNDFGAHFITNRLAAAIGVGAQCRSVRHYGEAVLLRGKYYGYPLGLLTNPRFAVSGMAARLGARRDPPTSVAEWFRRTYGRALANEVAIPLVEAWSGVDADQLAPSVATEKLRNSMLQTLRLSAAARIRRRAVANGYSHVMPEHPTVWHVYPTGGVGVLVQRLADGLADAISLEAPVESIVVDGGRAVAVRAGGREYEVAAVVSTAPCHVLPRLVTGTDTLGHLGRFRFRAMVFVNLRLQGRDLLRDTVVWTPEPESPFFRLTETTRSMPWLAPPGKSMITVDIGCEVKDSIWSMDQDALVNLCLEHLQPIVPGIRKRFLGATVLRTPIAYPVYLSEYESERQRLKEGTGVDGLYSIGRNGEFAHILMEDVYWRTLGKTRQVLRDLAARG